MRRLFWFALACLLALQIAVHGYVTACVEYRLSPEALYPAAVYDIKAAIRFLRTNANKLNIIPDRIAISGSSAGNKTPPMLFINSSLPRFHAGRDSLITISNAHRIYSEVNTITSSPHPFWLFHPWFEPTVGYMAAFLDKILKNPTELEILTK